MTINNSDKSSNSNSELNLSGKLLIIVAGIIICVLIYLTATHKMKSRCNYSGNLLIGEETTKILQEILSGTNDDNSNNENDKSNNVDDNNNDNDGSRVVFYLLRGREPMKNGSWWSLGNRLHGVLTLLSADGKRIVNVHLKINRGEKWSVLVKPPMSPLLSLMTTRQGGDERDNYADWRQLAIPIKRRFTLDEFSTIANETGNSHGDYDFLAGNCLHFRNSLCENIEKLNN